MKNIFTNQSNILGKKMRLNRIISVVLCLAICLSALAFLAGCRDKDEYKVNKDLDTSKDIVLRIASGNKAWTEMENVITKFEKFYPNCKIECVYIEAFLSNIDTRLQQTEEKIDIFKTANIQEATTYKDKVINLLSAESKQILDLSKTNEGLVNNFKFAAQEDTLYAVPYGGEMRGMYVNKTLLKKYNLSVPKNRAELLNCCAVLLEAGYIPLQSSSGTFAQQLMYPYICNSIVNGGNYQTMYNAIENIDDGISEYFRDAYSFLYDVVKKGYYDYKRVEEELLYSFNGAEGKARDFLNITKTSDDTYQKNDDIGKIAFMPDAKSFETVLTKTIEAYESKIEYEFIASPVGTDGGYAYLSPADGLAINKESDNKDWALEFLNFLFTPEVNKSFAADSGIIANMKDTSDALSKYDIAANRICDVGQVTFSYAFYKTVVTPMMGGFTEMVGISKMNAKKYMIDNGDDTYSFKFTLDEYIARLEQDFQKIKSARVAAE